jgi:hypothetical protein
MIEIPEPENEAKLIPKPPYKPTITDKPVPVPILVMSNATLTDKVSANPWWVGFKHFIYGAILAGGAALAAGSAWPVAAGLAITGGVAEAARKTLKDKNVAEGKNYADVIDKVLAIILELIKLWREKKSEKK